MWKKKRISAHKTKVNDTLPHLHPHKFQVPNLALVKIYDPCLSLDWTMEDLQEKFSHPMSSKRRALCLSQNSVILAAPRLDFLFPSIKYLLFFIQARSSMVSHGYTFWIVIFFFFPK